MREVFIPRLLKGTIMMRFFIGLLLVSIFAGCGYKPSAYYTKKVFGDKIYAQVSISRTDPKNSVIVKDAINEAIITRFLGRLASKEEADTSLKISFGSVTFSNVLYNSSGYVTAKKAKITLAISYVTKDGKSGSLSTVGEYDFSITEEDDGSTNSVVSEANRFEAIKYASLDAINEFVSAISVKGMQK